MESPYNGTGGPNNTLAEANAQTTGTARYKWKWVPPNDASGQPDTANFPVPPLFVLADVTLQAATRVPSGNIPYGLTASGNLADGLPDNWSDTLTAFPQQIGSAVPRRAVLPTAADPSLTSVYTVSLSPSGLLDVTGQRTVVQGYTASGATGVSAYEITAPAFPITLAAPDPFGRPDLGDGKNQFVYDAHEPDGILVVPASANVVGASSDDMAWVKSHITLPLTPAVAHIQPYTLTISGSSVVVSTPGHYPDPDTATSYPAASYIAKGLPANNSDFGNHVVTLTVDGTASELANCQLFYVGSASNWPTSDGSITDVKNFYHYYYPQYPKGAFTAGYDPSGYKSQFLAFTNFYNPFTIYIEEGTGGGDLEVPIFDINPVADADLHRNLVRQVGTLRIKGIHRYIWIAAHEWGHQKIFQKGGIYTTAVEDAADHHTWPTTSPDNDHVLDDWENTHHLRSDTSDTTHAYGGQEFEPEPSDDEVLADIQALPELLKNKDLWMLDWADFGVQYGGGSKLYWVAKPIATPAVFYWRFTPKVAGNPAGGSGIQPFQPFQSGSTTGPLGDGTYPIQTLKDLTDQYPSLLTDLPAHE